MLGFLPEHSVNGMIASLCKRRDEFADFTKEEYYNIRVFRTTAIRSPDTIRPFRWCDLVTFGPARIAGRESHVKSSETTFSVALCSYNGAPRGQAALRALPRKRGSRPRSRGMRRSIFRRKPRSVAAFAEQAPLEVRIEVNPQNLGVVENFEKAISLCRGDIIVLADQDDVWMPQKVARIAAVMNARPEIGFVFSDARRIDDRGEP